MVAEFYIIPDSFDSNYNNAPTDIESKTKSLAEDFVYIKKYKDTNKLFVHPAVYQVAFINGCSLSDLLLNPEVGKQHLDRDVYNALQKIIIESATTEHTVEEVIEVLLPGHDENLCYGLIAFNLVNGINLEFQIIYNLQGWFDFRRHYLGEYPKNANFYIDECIKYFPALYFHERNRTTVDDILGACPQKIVFHLSALNDKFRNFQQNGLNRTLVLRQFSIANELDEIASLEGNASKKPILTFRFTNKEDESIDICCEPHLKLCYNDKYPGDNSYSNNRRIYFHEGVTNIQDGRILIGHIGVHL